jgi:ribosomal protein L11 methyltransferase
MRQFVLSVAAEEVELASDALWGLGVVAVEERSNAEGGVELWTSLGDDIDDGDPLFLEWPWPHRFVDVDEAVAETWRQFAMPIHVSPTLVVRPTWVPYVAAPGERVLHIEPGSTFGMGDHPTTITCLRAVERLVRPGDHVLDVGCGSGVLAIAAATMGASNVVAVDIAPAAVPVTLANAVANGASIDVSTTPLEGVDGTFDLVLANILAPALVALAPHLRRVTGRHLVVSGILAESHAHVLDALAPLRAVHTETLDGWVAVTLER